MSLSSSIQFTATGGGTAISGVNATATGTEISQLSVSVPASTTNQLYTIGISSTDTTSLLIYTDGALTVKTNNSGSPAQTLTFASNYPLVWASGMPTSNPITTTVTALYLTNASTTTAVNLYGVVNQDL